MIRPRRIYFAVLLVSAGLCAIILSPVIEAAAGGGGAMNVAARLIFRSFCHQIPERSLRLLGVLLPVCARCSGIFLGFLAGWSFLPGLPKRMRDRSASDTFLLLGLGPMAIDGSLNYLGLVNSPNPLRLFTGLLFGATTARALWPALLEAAAVLGKGIQTGDGKEAT